MKSTEEVTNVDNVLESMVIIFQMITSKFTAWQAILEPHISHTQPSSIQTKFCCHVEWVLSLL